MAAVHSNSSAGSSLLALPKAGAAEPLVDLTYFWQWLPVFILNQRLKQGSSMIPLEHLQAQIHTCPKSGIVRARCSPEEAELFRPLLLLSSRVKQVIFENGVITVTLNRKASPISDHLMSMPRVEDKIGKRSHESHSIHFLESDTKHYISTYHSILEKIFYALKNRDIQVDIYLYGTDCHFFSFMLKELYSTFLSEVYLRPNYALRLHFKKLTEEERRGFLEQMREIIDPEKLLQDSRCDASNLGESEEAALLISEKAALQPEVEQSPIFHANQRKAPPYKSPPPRKSPLISPKKAIETNLLSPKKVVHFVNVEKNEKVSLALKGVSLQDLPRAADEVPPHWRMKKTIYLASEKNLSEHSFHKLPSPKRSFVCPLSALNFFCLPLNSPSCAENHLENKAYSLASTYLAYRLGQLPSKMTLKEEDWKMLWQEIDENLPRSPVFLNQEEQEKIQILALLKRSIEQKTFIPNEGANTRQLQKTNLYQVVRSFFPHEGTTEPLIRVRIDAEPLQIEAPSEKETDLCLLYFRSLLRSLALSQRFFDVDYSSLAHRLRHLDERLSLDGKNGEEKILLLMLQAGSFSFFLHTEISITEKITRKLKEKSYRVRLDYSESPTVEFFSILNDGFITIRTHTYLIKKDKEEKGHFVVKQKVSWCNGKWSFSIQIPAIDLNEHCSPKEQQEIYEGFE